MTEDRPRPHNAHERLANVRAKLAKGWSDGCARNSHDRCRGCVCPVCGCRERNRTDPNQLALDLG